MVLTMPVDRADPGCSSIADDFDARNRDDELPALRQIFRVLREDLAPEIPREYEQIIGAVLHHALRRDHRDAHSRRVPSLFEYVLVRNPLEHVGADTEVVE